MKAPTKKSIKLRKENNQYEGNKLRCFTWEFKGGCSQRMCMASFIFNWKLVEAEPGMGSLLAPVLANIFIGVRELQFGH